MNVVARIALGFSSVPRKSTKEEKDGKEVRNYLGLVFDVLLVHRS